MKLPQILIYNPDKAATLAMKLNTDGIQSLHLCEEKWTFPAHGIQ